MIGVQDLAANLSFLCPLCDDERGNRVTPSRNGNGLEFYDEWGGHTSEEIAPKISREALAEIERRLADGKPIRDDPPSNASNPPTPTPPEITEPPALALEPHILERFEEALPAAGLVGETANARSDLSPTDLPTATPTPRLTRHQGTVLRRQVFPR
jgi:hypothetical protein